MPLVPRHDGLPEGDGRGRNPQIVGADQKAVDPKVPVQLPILPTHVGITRERSKRRDEGLPSFSTVHGYTGGEFTHSRRFFEM